MNKVEIIKKKGKYEVFATILFRGSFGVFDTKQEAIAFIEQKKEDSHFNHHTAHIIYREDNE